MKAPKPRPKKRRLCDIQKLGVFELGHLARQILEASVGHELSWKVFHSVDFAAIQGVRGPMTRKKALQKAISDVIQQESAKPGAPPWVHDASATAIYLKTQTQKWA